MGKAHFTHACGGILPKCGAKLGYQLVLGPLLWEHPRLGALPYRQPHIIGCHKFII